jgi:potassium uptake Trk family protein
VAIFGSICLYPNGNLAYIDAIFLSSGGATQSGLNTVNLNALNTWQQIVLYIVPMMTNPIWINTFVVFLRLYWFEKRFQHYKLARKNNRRTISQALSQSRTNERNTGEEERGVEGRNIVVMHNTSANGAAQNNTVYRDQDNQEIKKDVAQSSDESGGHDERGSLESLKRRVTNEVPSQPQIKFADQVKRSNGLTDRTLSAPIHRRDEEHIAFLQRQRNPDDGAVLRIPGPRDADAGIPPTAVDESEAIRQIYSRQSSYHGSRHGGQDFEAFDDVDYSPNADQLRPRNITIEEPSPSGAVDKVAEDAHAAKKVFGIFRPRKARILKGEKLHEENSELNPARSRANTFQSLKTAFSQGKDEPTPYLSWEPTVGRNSMFVDLTESQREELGGIEYRSLKSLALILIAYFVGFSTFGVVCLIPWIYETKTYGSIVQQDGQGRGWWAVYTSNSAFTDLGFTLTPDSMISFNTATWPLLLLSFLIIIGNTGFPVMLRIIIWVTSKYVPSGSGIYEELKFLLDHPRRCFTLLFPAKATWWLFWILVLMNGIDLIFFIILDVGTTSLTFRNIVLIMFSLEILLSPSCQFAPVF